MRLKPKPAIRPQICLQRSVFPNALRSLLESVKSEACRLLGAGCLKQESCRQHLFAHPKRLVSRALVHRHFA